MESPSIEHLMRIAEAFYGKNCSVSFTFQNKSVRGVAKDILGNKPDIITDDPINETLTFDALVQKMIVRLVNSKDK